MRAAQRRRAREPYSIVLYDTMPGGTGYFPKLFANGADGLKAAAALALGRLEACDCAAAYDRCLRDFWNQCLHRLLNRFEAMAVLRRLAEGPALASPEAENEPVLLPGAGGGQVPEYEPCGSGRVGGS